MEKPENYPEEDHGKEDKGLSRRDLLKMAGLTFAGVASGIIPVEGQAKPNEQNRIKSSRLEIAANHNMHKGFARYKVHVTLENGQEKLIGSFFNMEDAHAKADLVSNKKYPQFFDDNGRPNFQDIRKKHEHTALIVAGAFLSTTGHHQIKGAALEHGEMVGEDTPAGEFNGLLVMKNGVPEIQYLNQIPNINTYLAQAKKEGWSLFQQASFIRPGGKFQSSNPNKYELRFFVEGEGKKGVINFSQDMTYKEALEVMQKMANFRIEKAICLDTGIASEGYFYDKNGKGYLMVDEDFGKGHGCTNMLVLYSDKQ